MTLETFEAGYAGARPPRTGVQWSGVWRLQQQMDRVIDQKWPAAGNLAGTAPLEKSFSIAAQTGSSTCLHIDSTKQYLYVGSATTIYQYDILIPGDLNTAFYEGKTFDVSAQEPLTNGVFFKTDGTAFYVVGQTNNTVYQYTCSTPWQITSATYASKSFSVAAQEVTTTDIAFKPDGTAFYIVGQTNDTVYQYSCSTAWDVSTASYAGKSFSVTSQENAPTALTFNAAGTKFYVTGTTSDNIYEYTCSTAWDLSTAANTIQAFSVTGQENTPQDVFFKDDGTIFYVIGNTNDRVYQYTCSIAWNLTTATYSGKSFSVTTQDGTPAGLFFKPDGTKFYIVGQVNDTVYQYSCSTAWDVSTASYDSKSFSVASQDTAPQGLFFKPDGTKFYMLGSINRTIYQYSCSTAWDVSTASYDSKSFSVTTQDTAPTGLFFKPDGAKFYIVGQTNDTVYQYSCSTAWDISTASYDSKSFNITTQENSPTGLFFKPDGTKFYVVGITNDTVYQYDISRSPWDVASATYMSGILNGHNSIENNARGLVIDSSSSSIYIVGDGSDIIYELKISTYPSGFQIARYSPLISGQEGTGEAIFFSSDGTKFYILGQANDRVYQYELTTAWDLNDFYYSQKSFAVTQEGTAGGLFFKPDGTKFYIVGTTNDTVYQYSCATAWDVSTASYDSKSFSIGGQESTARGLFFKPDGTRFYVGGNTNNNVYEYVCSTAWDVSTAAFSGARFNAIQLNFLGTNIFDLAFNSSGTKFYIVSISPNPVVLEFKCSSPWYILDAMWTGVSFNTTNQDSDMRALFIKPDDTKLYLLGQTTDRVFSYQLV